jgi:hypothetical protein
MGKKESGKGPGSSKDCCITFFLLVKSRNSTRSSRIRHYAVPLKHQHPLVLCLHITRGIEEDLPEARVPDVQNGIEGSLFGDPPLLERGNKRKEVEILAPGNGIDQILDIKDR